MKKFLIISLILITTLILFGCSDKYTKKEFCLKEGFEQKVNWRYANNNLQDESFFCFKIENDKVITSKVHQDKERGYYTGDCK